MNNEGEVNIRMDLSNVGVSKSEDKMNTGIVLSNVGINKSEDRMNIGVDVSSVGVSKSEDKVNIKIEDKVNIGIESNNTELNSNKNERGACWEHNFNVEFPIIYRNVKNGVVSVDVDSPHAGYMIRGKLLNGVLNGKCVLLNGNCNVIGSFNFVDGIVNGVCRINDENGILFFEGNMKNGYREGYGIEYDLNGNVMYEGLYKQGKRMNIVEMKEMKGYWKEMNEEGELISICHKNKKYENDGICYFYSNGEIDRISEWKNGKEISDSGYCRIYDEPNKVFFEGHFENGKREGKGKEIDLNGKLVFDGFYGNGRRMNIVEMKEMKGYWKELNEKNELISICHKNKKYENDGICYFYVNGSISKVSEWKNGDELNVLKRFEGNKMIEYKNGMMIYKGGYLNRIEYDYCRHGMGEEYGRNGKIVYRGEYYNGKRPSNMKLCCIRSCECLGNSFKSCWSWLKSDKGFIAIMVILWVISAIAVLVVCIEVGIWYVGIGMIVFELIFIVMVRYLPQCLCDANDDVLDAMWVVGLFPTILSNIVGSFVLYFLEA